MSWALTYITNVSIIVQFLIALVGLGVAMDYALMMIFRFRDELLEGNDVESALVETMSHAGRSVIVSGSTVAVRSSPRRRLGPGARRAPPPGRGRRCRAGDRRCARGPRNAAERKRGAAEELPGTGTAIAGRHMLADAHISPRVMKPLDVLVEHGGNAQQVAAKLRTVPGVVGATAPPTRHRGPTRWSKHSPRSTGPPQASRESSIASTPRSWGPHGTLTGVAAVDRDFLHALFGSFPYVFAFVVILTLILLARAFRSIVLAIKAALLNLVSLAAAFGIVVFVFQQGHGSSLWNIDATQSVTAYIPLMIFAFLYGPLDGLRGVHAHAHARGEGAFYKMQTLSQALVELVLASTVAREVAAAAAPNRHDFVIQLGQAEKTRAAAAAAPSLEAELAPEPEGLEPAAQDVPLRVVSLPRPAARPPSGG